VDEKASTIANQDFSLAVEVIMVFFVMCHLKLTKVKFV